MPSASGITEGTADDFNSDYDNFFDDSTGCSMTYSTIVAPPPVTSRHNVLRCFISHLKLLPIWTKSNFSAFLLNSRHFKFQISPTLDKTPSIFAETIFFIENCFKKDFSKCLELSKKAEKFDFVQIGSSFKCYMTII